MADSDALRARRRRRHAAGDHSICIPGRCKALDEAETPLEPTNGAGAKLWAALTADGDLAPIQHVRAVEACRMVDRLEALNRQLAGGDWLRFRHDETGTEVTVYVDRVLAEAREQATALRGLLADIEKAIPQPKSEPKGGGKLASVVAILEAARPSADRGPAAG